MQNERGIKKDPLTGDQQYHAAQHIQSMLFAERSLIQHTLQVRSKQQELKLMKNAHPCN